MVAVDAAAGLFGFAADRAATTPPTTAPVTITAVTATVAALLARRNFDSQCPEWPVDDAAEPPPPRPADPTPPAVAAAVAPADPAPEASATPTPTPPANAATPALVTQSAPKDLRAASPSSDRKSRAD